MVPSASIAESDIDTQVGFGVIATDTVEDDGSMSFATTRRVISVSVMIPARPPFESTTRDASPRLFASICVIERMLSFVEEINGFLGRSFETGRSKPDSPKAQRFDFDERPVPHAVFDRETPDERLTSDRSSRFSFCVATLVGGWTIIGFLAEAPITGADLVDLSSTGGVLLLSVSTRASIFSI